ncbi:MAG: cellulase family glycosylhydrolase [Lachnospiraceae bacterium]
MSALAYCSIPTQRYTSFITIHLEGEFDYDISDISQWNKLRRLAVAVRISHQSAINRCKDPAVFYNFHYYEPQVFTHQKAHFSEEMKDYNQTVTYPGDISSFAEYLKSHPEYLMKYQLVAKEYNNDKKLMEKLLKDAVDFVRYTGCSLYCGEYGVIDSAPSSEAVKWIRDLLFILDENHIGHALWNYKALDFGLLDLDGNIVSEEFPHFIIQNNH